MKALDSAEIGDLVNKDNIPNDYFHKEIKVGDDLIEIFIWPFGEDNDSHGFKFCCGEFWGLAQNLALPVEDRADPDERSLRVNSEGWAAFDGLRHITTYWNYINWELKDQYYEVMRQLEENLCRDFTGNRLTSQEFKEVCNNLGFYQLSEQPIQFGDNK